MYGTILRRITIYNAKFGIKPSILAKKKHFKLHSENFFEFVLDYHNSSPLEIYAHPDRELVRIGFGGE